MLGHRGLKHSRPQVVNESTEAVRMPEKKTRASLSDRPLDQTTTVQEHAAFRDNHRHGRQALVGFKEDMWASDEEFVG